MSEEIIWNEPLIERDPNFGFYQEPFLYRIISWLINRGVVIVAQAFEVFGIDVSKWNGDMNFAITESRGVKFVYVRAGFGNSARDERLNANRIKLDAQPGLEWGLYWFCYIGSTNATTAAASFYNIWKENPGKLPPVADLETTTLDPVGTTAWVWQFQQTFENLSGVQLAYYTSPGWSNSHLVINSAWPLWNRKLWVAHWTTGITPILPNLWSSKGKQCTFWQYSAGGNGLGVFYGAPPPPAATKDMDLDKYNGSLSNFNDEFGLAPPPPPPPPPDPEPEEINMEVLDRLTTKISATPPEGVFLTGSSNGIQVALPSIPTGATGARLRLVFLADRVGNFVATGGGAVGLQRFHYVGRAAIASSDFELNLDRPWVEFTADVGLKDGKFFRQHNAQDGKILLFTEIIGWLYPAVMIPADTEERLTALETWKAAVDALVAKVKAAWQ